MLEFFGAIFQLLAFCGAIFLIKMWADGVFDNKDKK